MKLVAFSDAHGNREIVERIISFNPDADYFISLGDSELPLDYLLDLDIIPIKGNYPRDAGFVYERDFEVGGKKIFLTHGHKYGVHRDLRKLLKKAFQTDYDMVLFGHTHIAYQQKVGTVLLINPGSVTRARNQMKPSYVIINIVDNEIQWTFKESETNRTIEL